MDPTQNAATPTQIPMAQHNEPPPVVPGPSEEGFAAFLASRGGPGEQSPKETTPAPTPPSDPTPTPPAPTNAEPERDFLGEKTPPKPADAPAVDDDAPPNTTEKGKYKWGELRRKAEERDEIERKWQAEQAERQRERDDLNRQLEELRKEDPMTLKQQIEAERKAREEYERRLAEKDIEESETWKNDVWAPLKEASKEVSELAKRYGIDEDQLMGAVYNADPAARHKKLVELTTEFSPYDVSILRDNERLIQDRIRHGQFLRDHAFEAKKELEYQRQQQQEAEKATRQQNYDRARREMTKQLTSRFPWLNEAPEVMQKLSAVKPSDDPMRQIFAEGLLEAAPALVKRMEALQAERDSLQAELTKRSQLGVRAGQGAAPTINQQRQAEQMHYENPQPSINNGFQMDDPMARFNAFMARKNAG